MQVIRGLQSYFAAIARLELVEALVRAAEVGVALVKYTCSAIKTIVFPDRSGAEPMPSVSLFEHLKHPCTLGGGPHRAVIGADTGHGATVGIAIKAAVGIPKLDPCPLGFL